MSAYYDDGPFKITQWNALISDINTVLANPIGECNPIDPIDTVEDPYIWLVEDVEEVRSKMIETCPNIEFTEELEIWHTEIIDEIESQISDMWCDCEACTAPVVEVAKERVGWTTIDACQSEAMSGTVESGTCYYCVGQPHTREVYLAPWYPPLGGTNVYAWNTICSTYDAATDKQLEFILAVNEAQRHACRLEKAQEELDTEILPDLDAAISQYIAAGCDANPSLPGCNALRQQICLLGSEAQEQQTIIDDIQEEFIVEYDKIEPAKTECDTLAMENMLAALSLEQRFPNEWQGIQWAIPYIVQLNLNWGKWFNPWIDKVISTYSQAVYNQEDDFCDTTNPSLASTCNYDFQGGVRPYVTITDYVSYPGVIVATLRIRISPGGIPFLSYEQADRLLVSHVVRYYNVEVQHRCDAAPPSCLVPCVYEDAITYLRWWDGGDLEDEVCGGLRGCYDGDFCSINLSFYAEARYTPASYVEFTLKYKAIRQRLNKDYTERQEAFYNQYINWFDEDNHPKYDNRHEDYC